MKTLRILSILMFIALSAGFTSCSDDDDKGDELIGTWLITKKQTTIKYENGKPDKVGATETVTDEVYTFNADKTGITTWVDEDNGEKKSASFTWKRNGNNLIGNYNGKEDQIGEILTLNSNELVLKYTHDDGDLYILTSTYKRVK